MAVAALAAAVMGAATSLGSTIYGSMQSRKNRAKALNLLSRLKSDNQKWYDTQMAQDYTQRSDTQAILKKQKELLDEHYNKARATNVVAGGTDEALAMQKQQANDTLADTMTNIASQASAHKDAVEQQYINQKNALIQQQAGIYTGQAQSVAQAAGQGVSAGLNLVGAGIGSTSNNAGTSTGSTPKKAEN